MRVCGGQIKIERPESLERDTGDCAGHCEFVLKSVMMAEQADGRDRTQAQRLQDAE